MAIYPGRRAGTWRVVVWSRNQAHEEVVEGAKSDAAQHEARMRLALAARKATTTRTAPLFSAFCADEYQPHAESHLGDRTWRKSRIYQVATLVRLLGSLRTSEIDTASIESYKTTRLRETWRGRRISASSVNNELRVLGTMLGWARTLGYPVAEQTIKRLPTSGAGRVHAWTSSELQQLFSAARDKAPHFLPMLVFLVNTGCRKGEAIAAEWEWMDLPGKMIRIPVTEFWHPKGKRAREVPMADAVAAILSGPRQHERWVFPSRMGGRYADFPKDAFWTARDAAGLTGGIHCTRHTFASHFLASRPDLFLLAQVLGHSHQRVTELYSHLLPDHLARARNAVNIAPKTMALPMAAGDRKRRNSPK